jgi:type IX secretion system substrate protein
MKKLFTLLFLLCTYACQAQNYQCLQSGILHYFTNSNGYLRGIRIDSVKSIGSDIVYYPFHTLRGSYFYMMNEWLTDSSGGCWLGKNVIQQTDGTFLFDNLSGDTVVVKTLANPGDSWVFYNDTSSRYYIASVVATDTMTVLGTIDSVKKIKVTSYLAGIINSTDPLNNFEIILSKNNGFVSVFDLYTFPYHSPDTNAYVPAYDIYLDMIVSYPDWIARLGTRPNSFNSIFSLVNFHNPTQLEIFNFNIGDVFFYNQHINYFYGSGGTIIFDSIISKTSPDPYHVEYSVYEWSYGTTYGSGMDYGMVWHTFYDSIKTLTFDTSGIFNPGIMPESEGTFDSIYYYRPNDTTHCFTSDYYAVTSELFEGDDYSTAYKPGFEEVSYSTFDHSATYSSSLVYWLKNGIQCGTPPAQPNRIPALTGKNYCQISPNPATDELTIKTSITLPYTITLTNMVGQAVTTIHTTKQQETLNLTNAPSGVYTVNVTDEGGSRYNEKVVITH